MVVTRILVSRDALNDARDSAAECTHLAPRDALVISRSEMSTLLTVPFHFLDLLAQPRHHATFVVINGADRGL